MPATALQRRGQPRCFSKATRSPREISPIRPCYRSRRTENIARALQSKALRPRPRGDAGSVSLLLISRLCRLPGCARGGRTTRPRSRIYLPSGRTPSALQGEVPLGNALVVVAKEGRPGVFGQVGEFRRLFPNPLRSRWAGHSHSPTAPRPATNDGLGIKRAPTRARSPIFPDMILPQKAAFPGAEMRRWARISAVVVCRTLCVSGNTLANAFPFERESSANRLHGGSVRRLSRGMTVPRCRARCYQARPEGPILADAFADAAARCSLAAFSALAVLGLAGVRRTWDGFPGRVGASRRRPLCSSGKGLIRG
jgi:hypothetical protein